MRSVGSGRATGEGGESGRGGHESEKAGLPFEPGNYTEPHQTKPGQRKLRHRPWKFEK